MTAPTTVFVDRRRPRRPGQSATEMLAAFSGLVLLERLPIPALAVRDDGHIVFANEAFVGMVGHSKPRLTAIPLPTMVRGISLGTSHVVTKLRRHANSVVELMHAEGWTVPAAMSASLLLRSDDPLALVTFVDLTEQFWQDSGEVKGISYLPV